MMAVVVADCSGYVAQFDWVHFSPCTDIDQTERLAGASLLKLQVARQSSSPPPLDRMARFVRYVLSNSQVRWYADSR